MLARGKSFHDNGATSAAAVLADLSTWQSILFLLLHMLNSH
jgi:hypothetical protein